MRSSGPGVFGYGTGAGGRNELCRANMFVRFLSNCTDSKSDRVYLVSKGNVRKRFCGTEGAQPLLPKTAHPRKIGFSNAAYDYQGIARLTRDTNYFLSYWW